MNDICIVGSSKTGSTGVYSSIKKALISGDIPFYGMHEKYPAEMFRALRLYAPDRAILAKQLLTNRHFSRKVAADFDKRILIARDPRDTLVSVMLYYPVLAINRGVPMAEIERFATMVKEKEADAESHSFVQLLVAVYRLMGREIPDDASFNKRFRQVSAYAAKVDSFLLHYEDFVRDHLADLSDYLDLQVENTMPDDHNKIVFRSGSSGDWTSWFLPSDVDHLRPQMSEYMDQFGYADDWTLPDHPRIDPAQGSEYVLSATAKRRDQIALNNAQGEASVAQQLSLLRARADDGSASAAYRAVRLLRSHPDLAAHPSEEFDLALFASSCGDVAAMKLLANCYRDGRGVAADPKRARFWRREHAFGTQQERMKAELESLRKEVEQIRTDSGHETLGGKVAAAATEAGARLRGIAGKLRQMARQLRNDSPE